MILMRIKHSKKMIDIIKKANINILAKVSKGVKKCQTNLFYKIFI